MLMIKDIDIRAYLEDFSFKHRLIRRTVTIRNGSFMAYAWHPKPWTMKDSSPNFMAIGQCFTK